MSSPGGTPACLGFTQTAGYRHGCMTLVGAYFPSHPLQQKGVVRA